MAKRKMTGPRLFVVVCGACDEVKWPRKWRGKSPLDVPSKAGRPFGKAVQAADRSEIFYTFQVSGPPPAPRGPSPRR